MRITTTNLQRTILATACLFLQAVVQAQLPPLGTPIVRNFTKEVYQGGTQNWDGYVAGNGVVYVANNEGLLAFDGVGWSKYPLPNRTIVRSVTGDEQGRIYVGGQGELGYFLADGNGRLAYHNLLPRVPKNARGFDDVWNLFLDDGQLFWLASGRAYRLSMDGTDSAHVLSLPGTATYLQACQGSVLAHLQDGTGLWEWTLEAGFVPFAGVPVLPDVAVTEILPFGDAGFLMTTLKQGVYTWTEAGLERFSSAWTPIFEEHRIYAACQLKDGRYAIGTTTSGVIVLSAAGEVEAMYSRTDGLQFNNVLSLVEDRSGNLWLALDNGVDMVAVSSPFTRFYPDGDLLGTAYAMAMHDGLVYCGTNNGLYAMDPTKSYGERSFSLVPGSRGQVWSLGVYRNELLMGHHEGAFRIRGMTLEKLASGTGTWLFRPIPATGLGGTMAMIAGTYNGLHRYRWEGTWVYDGPLESFSESSRFLAFGLSGRLWIAHPYKGLWSAGIDNNGLTGLRYHGLEDGLPTTNGLQVFPVGDEAVITASNARAWRYDDGQGSFLSHEHFDALVKGNAVYRAILTGEEDDLWVVTTEDIHHLSIADRGVEKAVQVSTIPELRNSLVGGFEAIFDAPGPDVFFATDKGFVQYREPLESNPAEGVTLLLREVALSGKQDSVVFSGLGSMDSTRVWEFPSYQKAFRFTFGATEYQRPDRVEYTWQLQGFESAWSEWSTKTEKEYTNLRPGAYTFHVLARGIHGERIGATSYQFRIAAPWYASSWAFLLYLLVATGSMSLLVLAPRRKFAKEKIRIVSEQQRTLQEQQAKHEETVETSTREITTLRNEKLQGEIAHQNRQLAMTTMHLVQKNAMITKVKEEMARIEQSKNPDDTRKSTRQVIGLLDADHRLDEDWEQFAFHFDKVHTEFLARLRNSNPQLTPKDQKLCAYLRLNLSSKEIAPLLNISVRGVEISRYRLRKKLALETDVNLVDYLMGI